MASEADAESDFNPDTLLADLEPLEDLDDAEFGLPPVENPPSLEDILAGNDDNDEEFEDGVDLDDAASSSSTVPIAQACPNTLSIALRQLNNSSQDTLSIGSESKSRGSNRSQSKSGSKRDKGSIMRYFVVIFSCVIFSFLRNLSFIFRHVIFRGISAQMASAKDRADAGLPTVMAAGIYIAIGTSHGFVLIFDCNQTLKYSLGGANYGRDCGSVSCLAFDNNAEEGPTRLLVGFAKGHIIEYDLTTGKLLRKLDEAHPIGSAIIRARFTEEKALALISDAGGSVFELSLKKTLGLRSYSSRCIFSGSRGEVCTFEPLGQYSSHASLSNRIVVALATISKVIVLTIRPVMKVLFTFPLSGGTKTLPLLAWQFVIIQTSKNSKVVDPVLAFGRQNVIHFYQLSESLSGKVAFVPLQQVHLPFELLNFGWLNTRCMAFLDSTETFHLYDVRNQEDLETIDLSDVQLVYGSPFFKGLATGGNVSAAMATAGAKATYESVVTFTNQIILLGRSSFHVLMIRTWNERIEYLVKANNYLDCIALGTDFYTDQGKAVVGLKGSKEKKKSVIGNKMLSVLLKYLNVCMSKNFPQEGNMTVLKEYFATIVPPCVNLCLTLKRKDVLFDQVWNAFQVDPFAKATFLECLESFILSDQLRNVPVSITQEFVKHYEITERYMALEACVTHLNVPSLDIHQVMNVCWTHGLYDAIIYIYNNGMLDFVTPAEELFAILIQAMDSSGFNESQHINNGYESVTKRLTSSQIKLGNKLLVYISCCLAGRAYPYGDIANDQVKRVKTDVYACLTALHSKKAAEDELVYPYLRTLLTFDTQGLLNVLAIAFEEPEFKTESGGCLKQMCVDILLRIMVRDHSPELSSFSPSQVAYLFTFLAQQIAKENHCLSVSRQLFEQVLDVLTDTREKSHHEERQQALLDMLNAGGMEYFDRDHLIFRAQKVGFYRILEMLYTKNEDYVKLLSTYIDDPYRQNQVFSFVQKVLVEDHSDYHDMKSQVEKSVLDNLETLISIDNQKTATVIFFHMYPYIPLVLAKLENSKRVLYDFLKHLLDHKESGSQPTTPIKQSKQVEDPLTSQETYEGYIDLMCQLDSKSLSSFLRSKSGYYRPEAALRLAAKYGIKDAQAYLLEQDGRIKDAFDLMKAEVKEQVGQALKEPGEPLSWSRLNATVVLVIQLCQRCSQIISEKDRDQLWFDLMDALAVKANTESEDLKKVLKHVVTSSLGHISLQNLVDRILGNPVYQSDNFGEFLKDILEMYHYEETLMCSTTMAIHQDIHALQLKWQAQQRRGFSVRSLECGLCSTHLAEGGGPVIVFQGNQKFKMKCLRNAGNLRLQLDKGQEVWLRYDNCLDQQASKDYKDEIVISEEDLDVQDHDEPSVEIVQEITNQQVVKAHAYVSKLKAMKNEDSSLLDVELKLSPKYPNE